MKTRLLIIIGIIITISVSVLIIIDNIETQTIFPYPRNDHNTLDELRTILQLCEKPWEDRGMYQKYRNQTHQLGTHTCEWEIIENSSFNPLSGLGILHALSVADKEELQNVLDNCDCQESGQTPCKLPRLSYQNDTHSIDNLDCEWVTISNEERDVKLAAGYKLYPGVGWVAPSEQNTMEPIYRYHPETGEKVLDLDAILKIQKVLDDCGARFYEPDIKLVFTNSTHSIDNIDCEWELKDEN